jgi:hypothetical protein
VKEANLNIKFASTMFNCCLARRSRGPVPVKVYSICDIRTLIEGFGRIKKVAQCTVRFKSTVFD